MQPATTRRAAGLVGHAIRHQSCRLRLQLATILAIHLVLGQTRTLCGLAMSHWPYWPQSAIGPATILRWPCRWPYRPQSCHWPFQQRSAALPATLTMQSVISSCTPRPQFATDLAIRHVLGQPRSVVSLVLGRDGRCWPRPSPRWPPIRRPRLSAPATIRHRHCWPCNPQSAVGLVVGRGHEVSLVSCTRWP
jgi:hypothetical protein